MMATKITVTEIPEAHLKQVVVAPLARFNEAQSGRCEDYRRLAILISHPVSDEIVGGLWGETMYSYLHVDVMFVPEFLRGIGIDRRLMIEAESEAVRRGCGGAWLDTYSFQARGFYEHSVIPCSALSRIILQGHSRFFLQKIL